MQVLLNTYHLKNPPQSSIQFRWLDKSPFYPTTHEWSGKHCTGKWIA